MNPDRLIQVGENKTMKYSELRHYTHCEHKSPFTLSCDGACFEAHGISARCIEAVMTGMSFYSLGNCTPRDFDDFGRDYDILQKHPEWLPQLHKMTRKNAIWEALARHWPVLTNMYEAKQFDDLNCLLETIGRRYSRKPGLYCAIGFTPSVYFIEQVQAMPLGVKELKTTTILSPRKTRSTLSKVELGKFAN